MTHPIDAWIEQAIALVTATQKHCRIKALHLTDEQRQDLEDATGQDAMLLGHPVTGFKPLGLVETDTQRWARICREDWTGAPWDPRLEHIIAQGPDAQA